MISASELDERVRSVLPDVISFRRELHRIPEIAGREFDTCARIREKLSVLNLEILPPFLKTDTVAFLNRGKKRNLTLRADIDALPLEEASGVPWCSTRPGMMHACGHDGHTAMLFGAARVLSSIREQVNVSVRFLFQPGEEAAAMARDVLASGALSNPEPDFISGLHSWPDVPWGKIACRGGVMMAAAGFFKIILTGRGGHGSLPKLANNPLDCAAELMSACRGLAPEGCVLTFCRCSGGRNSIVIPETAELEGTIRFLERGQGEKMVSDFRDTVSRIAEKNKIRFSFECPLPYVPLRNRAEDFERVRSLVSSFWGADAFYELPGHTMSSEDFAYYLEKYPGVFCHLGSGASAPLHSCRFDFDERLLAFGIRYFCLLALHPPFAE